MGRKANRKFNNFFFPTGQILLYHRIANVKSDPHLLSVSPDNFYDQLDFLKNNFNIVPLAQIVKWIKEKKFKDRAVAITFDDGYADNLQNALPILKKLGVPATIFVTAGHIDSGTHFYWDNETPETDRGKPVSHDELITLAGCNLIEIGAHTMNHPKLKKINLEDQEMEIRQSKETIENIVGIPVTGFAYPFGGQDSFDNQTIGLVKKSGFGYACANIHERVRNGSDIFALPRFVMRNWGIDEFKQNLKKFI